MPLTKSEKPKLVEEMKNLIITSKTIAILDMTKLKAGPKFKIKNGMLEHAKFKMARKPLLERALKESGKEGVEKLLEKVDGSVELVFSDLDPFKLYAEVKKNRAKAAAKVGDVVPDDVVVPKGSTGIPPGPAITVLQKAKLKTKVEGGKIAVIKDTTVIKAGDTVNEDVAAVLALLNIQPIEVGLNMPAAWEEGMIYGRDILDVSPEEYAQKVEAAVHASINLSVNIAWPTPDNAVLLLQKAFIEARSLAMESNMLDATIIGDLLAKAAREAAALESLVPEAPKEEPKEETKEETPTEEKTSEEKKE